MKNRLLKDLYDSFYIPTEFSAQKQGIKECHQALIEAMDKQGRRSVLRIIDAKDYMIENISIDSFFSGFELAWKLSEELNNYENEYPISCRKARELSTRFLFKREEKMKKYIMAVVIAACLALCAAVWPQGEVVEEAPQPTREIAGNTQEKPVVAPQRENQSFTADRERKYRAFKAEIAQGNHF